MVTDSKYMTIENVERQRQYVAQQKQRGPGLGVVFADAFLRGMRLDSHQDEPGDFSRDDTTRGRDGLIGTGRAV